MIELLNRFRDFYETKEVPYQMLDQIAKKNEMLLKTPNFTHLELARLLLIIIPIQAKLTATSQMRLLASDTRMLEHADEHTRKRMAAR